MFRRALAPTGLTVIVVLLFTGILHAYEGPYDPIFWSTVGSADFVVIGRITSTPQNDQTVSERVSVLVVEECFSGKAATGDSLEIFWRASRWYPRDGATSVSSNAGPQLIDFTGDRSLWLLYKVNDPNPNSQIRSTLGAFRISNDNKRELKKLVGLLDEHVGEDQANPLASAVNFSRRQRANAHEVREAISHRLKEFLAEFEDR